MGDSAEAKGIELEAIIREIRDRVRERFPSSAGGDSPIPLADLTEVLHARDRAEAKVAAIGAVNPRPPGLVNDLIQAAKRTVARGLNWFVREQVEFNRASLDCVQALVEALNETNRALVALAARSERIEQRLENLAGRLEKEAGQMRDVRQHWAEWRQEWERKLSINEVQFLRSVADLQGAYQHRLTLLENSLREQSLAQHRDFRVALDEARIQIQERLWRDLERVRLQFERMIHGELRVMRQRVAALAGPQAPAHAPLPVSKALRLSEPPVDLMRLADRFRGSEEHVREKQRRYLEQFAGCEPVLDLGCGRGEFLELLRDAGCLAKGVEANEELAALCRSKGLYVEQADLFDYLGEIEPESVGGIFCAQLVEHLLPERVPELISLAAAALKPGGRILLETPNPECLAIFASHFYLDPTHQRPVPAQLLAFYLEENGFGQIRVDYLNPAVETMEAVAELPEAFRRVFFGGLDYAISAVRL